MELDKWTMRSSIEKIVDCYWKEKALEVLRRNNPKIIVDEVESKRPWS